MRNFELLKGFLGALQYKIANSNIFPSNNVNLTLFDELTEIPIGTPALAILAQDFNTLGWDAGGGIQDLAIRGLIKFKIMVLNTLDVVYNDTTAMTSTDQTLGAYELVDQLIAQAEMLDLCDSNGDTYLVEPMRFRSFSKPHRVEDHPEWVIIDVLFEATICQNIISVS
jgi:hypothetical protein